ncbi:hypothetical protein BH20BAC1_BH20BAC1_22410 [soil metagenome]
MENSKSNYLIPQNIEGKPTDVEHSVTVANSEEAAEIFKTACSKMLEINKWHKLIGSASAHFKDANGDDINPPAKVGDYIRIDIPGPGPSSGDGYDWVRVELMDDHRNATCEEESMGMRVRSSKNPKQNDAEVAHFFTGDATSVFIIHRKANVVTSSYHGRNEKLNTDTEKVYDKIRNAIVGTGAFIGLSELQWSFLMSAFVKKEN